MGAGRGAGRKENREIMSKVLQSRSLGGVNQRCNLQPGDCLRDISIAVIKFHDRGRLQKEAFVWAFWLQRDAIASQHSQEVGRTRLCSRTAENSHLMQGEHPGTDVRFWNPKAHPSDLLPLARSHSPSLPNHKDDTYNVLPTINFLNE